MTPDRYHEIRSAIIAAGYENEVTWAQNVGKDPPNTADDFAGEAIWVVCCSGFKAERARTTQAAVEAAISTGKSATTVFPKSGKGRAIDRLWADRQQLFDQFKELQAIGGDIVAWIATIPYVGGPILRYHFAKNLGVDCAKPDRHNDSRSISAAVA